MSYILAFDCGTTAIKAVCVHRETKEMFSSKMDCKLYRPSPECAEQDPDELWSCLCEAGKGAMLSGNIPPAEIDAVVIAAPWKNVILLDADNRPLHRSLIWMDARAVKQAEEIHSRMEDYSSTGQEYWPRVLWMKENHPDLWKKTRRVSGLNTYFKLRATGEFYTEWSDDLIHTPNASLQAYYNRIIAAAGLTEDLDKFPPSKRCTEQVGTLTEQGAKDMGLIPGIPVISGFGDLVAIPAGCGCMKPGTLHIYLGTSSWFCEVDTERRANYAGLYFTQDVGLESALVASLQTGAKAFSWIIDRFYDDVKSELGDGVFAYVNERIQNIPAGSDRLIVTHWLNGELPPEFNKNAKALFFNVDEHHTRDHFAKAMLESICYTHRMGLETYKKRHGKAPENIKVVGGGAMTSAWMQIMADVLKIPVIVPENPRYVGTLGSYYCAEVGLGRLQDFPDVSAANGTVYFPNPEASAVYDRLFEIYAQLQPALKAQYDRISEI